MTPEVDLLHAPLRTVATAPELFAEALAAQGVAVTRVDWRPPAAGHGLAALWCEAVDAANRLALDRLLAAQPVLVDVRPAIEVVPGLTRETVLHAGPPIDWDRMSGPLQGAVVGALLYEGLAKTEDDARRVAAGGAIRFDPCPHHASVGPVAAVRTAPSPVVVGGNPGGG